jgi:hypothetical protein
MPPESTRVELFGEPCVPGSSLKPEKKKPAGFLRSGNRSPRRPLASVNVLGSFFPVWLDDDGREGPRAIREAERLGKKRSRLPCAQG